MLGGHIKQSLLSMDMVELYGASRTAASENIPQEYMIGDLTVLESYTRFKNIHFDVIVHCAAEVNLSLCEKDWAVAELANVTSTSLLTSNLSFDRFIYISTDSVFDGSKGNYTETDQTHPLNNYALSKLKGEHVVTSSVGDFIVLRTNIYGASNPMRNSLFEWAYKELSEGRAINGYDNVIFNPLYIGQLTNIIKKIICEGIPPGIYNASCDGHISKFEFIIQLARMFGLNEKKIQPMSMNVEDELLKRPLNTSLNNRKLKSVLKGVDLTLSHGFLTLKNDLNE